MFFYPLNENIEILGMTFCHLEKFSELVLFACSTIDLVLQVHVTTSYFVSGTI